MPRFSVLNLLLPLTLATVLTGCGVPNVPDGSNNGLGNIAKQLQAGGDDAGAADFYQREVQNRPDDVDALRNLGAIFERHGDLAAADDCYSRALRIEPDDEDLLRAEGRLLIRLGHAEAAADIYRKLLDRDRHDVKALNGLGVALDYQGRHDEAQADYKAALDEESDDLATLNNLAHSYVLSGRYDDAIQLLEPHANDKDATPALRQNLAEAYGLNGMYADAERLSRMDLKPQDVKRNLAYYHARRAAAVPDAKFAADLGSYPTEDMAAAHAQMIGAEIGDDATAKIVIKPEVAQIGGTPQFAILVPGFANAAKLKAFCARMTAKGIACKPAKDF